MQQSMTDSSLSEHNNKLLQETVNRKKREINEMEDALSPFKEQVLFIVFFRNSRFLFGIIEHNEITEHYLEPIKWNNVV